MCLSIFYTYARLWTQGWIYEGATWRSLPPLGLIIICLRFNLRIIYPLEHNRSVSLPVVIFFWKKHRKWNTRRIWTGKKFRGRGSRKIIFILSAIIYNLPCRLLNLRNSYRISISVSINYFRILNGLAVFINSFYKWSIKISDKSRFE